MYTQEDMDKGCGSHLKICKAECCKMYTLVFPKGFKFPRIEKKMAIKIDLEGQPDRIRYYELHGATYKRGLLKMRVDDYSIKNNILIVKNRCEGLTDDLKCKYHGTDKQPIICHTPNARESVGLVGVEVTPNCLYKRD